MSDSIDALNEKQKIDLAVRSMASISRDPGRLHGRVFQSLVEIGEFESWVAAFHEYMQGRKPL